MSRLVAPYLYAIVNTNNTGNNHSEGREKQNKATGVAGAR
jgi:hypothetical protein